MCMPVGPFAATIFSLFWKGKALHAQHFCVFKAVLGPKKANNFDMKTQMDREKGLRLQSQSLLLKKGLGTAISSQFGVMSIDRDRTETPFFTTKLGKGTEKLAKIAAANGHTAMCIYVCKNKYISHFI